MISIRGIQEPDYNEIPGFFNNKNELQYSFPGIDFPAESVHLKSVIESRSNQTVLISNNQPAGFVDLYDIKPDEGCCIGNLIIHQDHRKNGFASMLLNEIIATAVESYSVKKINVFCWCENTGGLITYHKLGFRPSEMIVHEFNSAKVPVLKLEKIMKQNF